MVLKSALLASTCVGLPAVFTIISISALKLLFSGVPHGQSGSHLGHVGAAARANSATTRSKFWISNGETTKILCHSHARRSILNAIANRVCATIDPVIPSYQSVHNILSKTRSEGDGNGMSTISILFMDGPTIAHFPRFGYALRFHGFFAAYDRSESGCIASMSYRDPSSVLNVTVRRTP